MKKQEDDLFERWKQERGYTSFMKDGLFDEDQWNKQALKILYVLKEANWSNGNEDLCQYLLSEESPTYWKTWNNIVRWTQALRTGGAYPWSISKQDKTTCLKTVAAMNIKKVGGGARANSREIREYGQRDAQFLRQQIELYQPDIIVCCGRGNGKNADILFQFVLTDQSVWEEPIGIYNYFSTTLSTGKRIPVLSFRHPQIRGGHNVFMKYFQDMLAVAKELRNRKQLP